jgi:hypothetical protein
LSNRCNYNPLRRHAILAHRLKIWRCSLNVWVRPPLPPPFERCKPGAVVRHEKVRHGKVRHGLCRISPQGSLGFAGAFRRSELVGLSVDNCAFGKDGLTITLRRRKPATAWGRDMPPVPRLPEPVNGPSWRRPGTAACRWCGAYIRDGSLFRENSGAKLGL